MREAISPLRPLDRFEVADDGSHVLAGEAKFRHVRMAGDDAFGQSLLERFDRISLTERAERRCLRMLAGAGAANRVAARAIPRDKLLAALNRAFGRACGPNKHEIDTDPLKSHDGPRNSLSSQQNRVRFFEKDQFLC